jgi:chemotaxis protein MotB
LTEHHESQPIIIKRYKKKGHGHHGGAWKVAFADFAIAMMAFFLVLWLTEATTQPQKEAIAGYFKDPAGFMDKASVFVVDMKGAALQKEQGASKEIQDNPNDLERVESQEQLKGLIAADAVEDLAQQIEQQRFDQLMKEMQRRIDASKELSEYKDQILMTVTPDGLMIQIVDKESRPMFDLGSSRLKPYSYLILKGIVSLINSVPNKITISGHTDALSFQTMQNFTNWELSAERANAARRVLVQNGMPEEKVAEIVGLASSRLLDKKDPINPINRRISILVLSKKSEAELNRRSNAPEAASTQEILPDKTETDQKGGQIQNKNAPSVQNLVPAIKGSSVVVDKIKPTISQKDVKTRTSTVTNKPLEKSNKSKAIEEELF